jgi:hypothetical protein
MLAAFAFLGFGPFTGVKAPANRFCDRFSAPQNGPPSSAPSSSRFSISSSSWMPSFSEFHRAY